MPTNWVCRPRKLWIPFSMYGFSSISRIEVFTYTVLMDHCHRRLTQSSLKAPSDIKQTLIKSLIWCRATIAPPHARPYPNTPQTAQIICKNRHDAWAIRLSPTPSTADTNELGLPAQEALDTFSHAWTFPILEMEVFARTVLIEREREEDLSGSLRIMDSIYLRKSSYTKSYKGRGLKEKANTACFPVRF